MPARQRAVAQLALLGALLCGCKPPSAPPGPPEALLATDLDAPMVETALRIIAANGGPRAQRVPENAAEASTLLSSAATKSGAEGKPAGAEAKAQSDREADVHWDLEPYGAIAAAARGVLLPMPASAGEVPALWRDPGGTWVAVGGRAEVLLVAVDELGEHGAPVRFTALTQPWLKGKVALVAPTGGPSLAHFAALYQAWGPERMEAWLSGLKNNDVQVLDSDDAVRAAVVSGKATVGILSSDEAAKAAASAAHVLVVYPNQRSIGTFIWPTALWRSKNAAHPEAAARLAERLVERTIEQLLVARVPGFIPLRKDIPVPPGVRPAANLVVVSVDPARIVEEINRRRAQLAAWTEQARKKV